MRSKIFLPLSYAFFLMLMKSLPCWAQAEIDPDHFDTRATTVFEAESIASANQAAGTFQGSFTLMHEVNCAGMTLKPGIYSLLIRPRGDWNVVTLIQKGTAGSIQVLVKTPTRAGRAAALILERTGRESILTAIRLQEPGTMLLMQPELNLNTSAHTELVPVSHAARK
jgi:hypothetical protein